MTERQQLPRRSVDESARSGTPIDQVDDVHRAETDPTGLPTIVVPPDDPTILGFPAEDIPEIAAEPIAEADPVLVDVIDPDAGLVVVRRADSSAGSLLMIAGAAGVLSLFLPWVQHDEALGLSLFRQGVDLAGSGVDAFVRSGLVLPLGVVVGGGVLFLLGLLAFRPTRTHRAVGVVALFVCLAVATGVVIRTADQGWVELRTDPGFLCAVVLAGFGLLGALKAMLTAPAYAAEVAAVGRR